MIRVLVADDHPLVRQGLHAVLDAAGDISVVADAADGRRAVALAAEHAPDVVLMDLQMPVLHGIDGTRQIRAARPRTAVLVLTMFDDDDTVFAAIAAGAAGYLLKGADGPDIIAAVRSTAAGHAVFGAALAARMQAWFARPRPNATDAFPELTAREREILDHLAGGQTNAEIAKALSVSAKTVANNVSMILAKLHLTQRGQAIVRARDAGLGKDRSP